MKYIPSPIPLRYDYMFSASSNKSGRMQYHRVKPGVSKLRISRAEFIKAYNESSIIALNPIQLRGQQDVFQLEFYI
ncbi:MAG: hypothetical protein JST48_14665 [Bacteroidetes bacterium]|nr:hypothetical protein [Bacteroidota bacterium]